MNVVIIDNAPLNLDGRGKHFDPVCIDVVFDSIDDILRIRDAFSDN